MQDSIYYDTTFRLDWVIEKWGISQVDIRISARMGRKIGITYFLSNPCDSRINLSHQ
jgi:hypothetical protein